MFKQLIFKFFKKWSYIDFDIKNNYIVLGI